MASDIYGLKNDYAALDPLTAAAVNDLVNLTDLLAGILTDMLGTLRGFGKTTDCNISTSASLITTLTAGRALMGTTYGARKAVRVTAHPLIYPASQAVVYTWVGTDGVPVVSANVLDAPANGELATTCVTSASAITSVNNNPTGRNNLQTLIPRKEAPMDALNSIGNTQPCHASITNIVWPGANRGVFTLIRPARDITIDTFKWREAVQSGNYDVGIYDSTGVRLWSKGSTTSPANGVVTVTITPALTLKARQTYYLAIALDNTTSSVSGAALASVDLAQEVGGAYSCFYLSTMFPLPSSITPASGLGAPFVPWMALYE